MKFKLNWPTLCFSSQRVLQHLTSFKPSAPFPKPPLHLKGHFTTLLYTTLHPITPWSCYPPSELNNTSPIFTILNFIGTQQLIIEISTTLYSSPLLPPTPPQGVEVEPGSSPGMLRSGHSLAIQVPRPQYWIIRLCVAGCHFNTEPMIPPHSGPR